jgi:hypothetical protein
VTAEAQLLAGLHDLLAGREHRDAGPAEYRDLSEPGSRQRGQVPRRQPHARGHDPRPRGKVAPRLPHVLAHGSAPQDRDMGRAGFRVLDRNDAVGTRRQRRARHHLEHGARRQVEEVRCAGRLHTGDR